MSSMNRSLVPARSPEVPLAERLLEIARHARSKAPIAAGSVDRPGWRERLRHAIESLRASRWAAVAWKLLGLLIVIVGLGFVGSGICDRWMPVRSTRASGALGALHAPAASAAPIESPPAASASAAPVASSSGAPCDTGGKIVLNTATASDLDKLPGIGPSKAEQIVELRAKLGKFTRLEELYRIKGIKRRLLEKIRPHVLLDPPAGCSG